jgi:hypothetical protein
MGGCGGKVEEVRVFEIFRETLEQCRWFVGRHWHCNGTEIFAHLLTVRVIENGWGRVSTFLRKKASREGGGIVH